MAAGRFLIVTPWFARDLTGGAERLAWQVATSLGDRGHEIHVFATCGEGFTRSWLRDYHAPGTTTEDGVIVHRFALSSRDEEAFERANAALLAQPTGMLVPEVSPVDQATASAFIDHTVRSRDLEDALVREASGFDGILFVPYLYGPTLHGFLGAAANSVFQPCLHDEPYAYLPHVAQIFHSARSLVFNSVAELQVAKRLYGPAVGAKSTVVGHWIDPVPETNVRRVGRLNVQQTRYVLYLGRRDRTKNLALLVQSYRDYRRYRDETALRLVLIGPGVTSFDDPRHGIDDLGFVSEDQKVALLRNATAIAQPSTNESFSRAMMEGFALGKPVLAHMRCTSTAEAVSASGAGFIAGSRAEWAQAFADLDAASPSRISEIAQCAKQYYRENGAAERVLERYERVLVAGRPSRESEPTVEEAAAPFDDRARRYVAARRSHLTEDEQRLLIPTVPIADPAYWDVRVDGSFMASLAQRRNLIVYASSTLDDRDCIEELLTAFAFLLSFGIDASLGVLGAFTQPASEERLRHLISEHQLSSRVELVSVFNRSQAAAYLRSARLFVSLAGAVTSHVALVDAMMHELPIVAFAGEGVREIVGDAAIVVTRKDDPVQLGALLKIALEDDGLRETVTSAGLRRINHFLLASRIYETDRIRRSTLR